ncbi:MAG TPA: tetratricopeptide repeat protein, partial [Acidobacteriota bacterium]|nr:tetratricopeptide repeat protein [Acidobacteriota bacterium]
RIHKAALRLLAMNRIDETRSITDEDGLIAAYLDAEDDFTALGDFETFIKERGLLSETGSDSPFKDLRTLDFRMGLDFKLNRYRDIARVGELLTSSSLVIAPSGRPSYVRILRLIGESNLKLDNIYAAEEYYRKALEAAPEDLEVLEGLERCYGRLNDEAKTAELGQAIDRLTGPGEVDLAGRVAGKGETVKVSLVTAGGPRTIRLEFSPAASGGRPLVSIFLDGRIAWEKYGDTGFAEFTGTLRPGPSSLEIAAVSEAVALGRIVLIDPAAR